MKHFYVRYESDNLACRNINLEHIISVNSLCAALATACKIRIHSKHYGDARNIRITMYDTNKPDQPAKIVFHFKEKR